MAEFDSGGLSAVSAFFGLDKKHSDEPPSHDASHHVSRRGRQGVGSVPQQVKHSATSDYTIGRVLKVGKQKRQRDDDDDGNSSHESDVEHDKEDEEGRTSLAATERPKVSTNDCIPVQIKKKKGKKERKVKALETTVKEEQGTADTRPGDQTTAEEDSDKAKQRKRRKTRSRQKNIYKDKRLAQHKPSHLILGRAEFAGRPLTAATRAKLNLAPSRSSRAQEHEDETEPLETPMHDSNSNGEEVKLAIDDLLDEGVVQGNKDISVVEQKPQVKKKVKKKKKNSKYKNLQL
jgi:hypothetical protein